MSAEGFDPTNLKEEVAARMKELGITNEQLSHRGGPSTTTTSKIKAGLQAPPRSDVLRKLDHGLRWKEGSALRVLRGGDPVPLPDGLDLEIVLAELDRVGMSESTRRQILVALEVIDSKTGEVRGA